MYLYVLFSWAKRDFVTWVCSTLWKKDLHQSLSFFNIFLLNLWLLFLINPALTIKPHKGDWHLSSPHRHCWITPKGHENNGKLLMVEHILPVRTIENSWTTLWRICMCCDVLIWGGRLVRLVRLGLTVTVISALGTRIFHSRTLQLSHRDKNWNIVLFYLDSRVEISLKNCTELLAPFL